MTTKAKNPAPSVVAEAREKTRQRFEKSRTRKKYGWAFEQWEERFVCGDKFTAIAAELTPAVTRHFVKDIFHRYFEYLANEHWLGRELRLEEYKAGEYARRESELPEDSMVRKILRAARDIGYRAEVVVNKANATMKTGARINGHLVIISPARGASKPRGGRNSQPMASFTVGRGTLSEKKVGGIILYITVPGYQERMFTYRRAELFEKYFAENNATFKRIGIPVTEPKQIETARRKFNHWRDHEGEKGLMRLDVPA